MKIHTQSTEEETIDFLLAIDANFYPKLSTRIDIDEYAEKLTNKANLICYKKGERVICAIYYYLDDSNKIAYIPVLGSVEGYEGKGLMRKLMDRLENILLCKKYISLCLETWLGSRALNIYIKRGFYVTSISEADKMGRVNVTLKKDIEKKFPFFQFQEPPVETNFRLNEELGISLFIKRDDLFPIIGGGSKARKLKFILKQAVNNGCTAVVTAGSNHSNHLRSTAIMCAELGMKFSACIHDDKPLENNIKGNLKITMNLAHRFSFVEKQNIKEVMDKEIDKFISEGEKPLYIWGGGHSVEGTYSYFQAANYTLQHLNVSPDYIFLASGTGTTQAGILFAINNQQMKTNVIGISVARDKERGEKIIKESINEMQLYFNNIDNNNSKINFDDSFLMGGYGKSTLELELFLDNIGKKYGIVLDPIYSGKAFFGLWQYVKSGRIKPGSNVLFWNTGGILNI